MNKERKIGISRWWGQSLAIVLLLTIVAMQLDTVFSYPSTAIAVDFSQNDEDENHEEVQPYEYFHVLEVDSSVEKRYIDFTFSFSRLVFESVEKNLFFRKDVAIHHLAYYLSLFRYFIATNAP